jgi:anthranilate phosphoribosyltransferase
VAAGAGATVAKHGNRAMTSACGSADVLEALGAKIDLGPEQVAHCLREVGFGFMFAQTFHPAMRFAAGPRREIGVRTVFNILGPLTNPAGAQAQVLGVADAAIGEKMIQALGRLGSRHALVVHGEDGLDEMSLAGPTLVHELKDGKVKSYSVMPEEVGLTRAKGQAVKGGSPEENAAAMRAVLGGEGGPLRDIVLLNSAAALVAADMAPTIAEGVAVAARTIDSGAAGQKLERFVEVSAGLA